MRRALTALLSFAALLALAAPAAAQHRVHVHAVRVGAHPGFDRVVVELDGPTDVAWERGPEPGAESFYLDADLGSRGRVVRSGLAQVGDVRLSALRVGTRVRLEPRERRVRAYVLASPARLVIDVAPPGPEEFAVPKGVTPLAPAKSLEPESEAGPGANPEPEKPEPEPEAGPPAEEVGPESPPEEAAPSPPTEEAPAETPRAETPPAPEAQAPGAGETAPPSAGAQPESAGAQPEAAPAQPEAAPAQPEAAAPAPPEPPRAAPAPAPTPPLVAPEPEAPAGFPWSLAFGTVAFIAALVISYLYLRERMDRPAPAPRLPRSPAGALTPSGVEGISPADLRGAADATSVLEQRLDEEVRARVALEERLAEAGEELKVLRDRVHRVERRREEAH